MCISLSKLCPGIVLYIVRRSRGENRGPGLENHKVKRFLRNMGPDPLGNHKATKPSFNVGTSPVRQRNAILMAFRWRAGDDLLLLVFGSALLSSILKYFIYNLASKIQN